MRIAGLAGNLPARRVGNEEVLDLIAHHSQAGFDGDLTSAGMVFSAVTFTY